MTTQHALDAARRGLFAKLPDGRMHSVLWPGDEEMEQACKAYMEVLVGPTLKGTRCEPSQSAVDVADEVLCRNEMSNSGADRDVVREALSEAYAVDFARLKLDAALGARLRHLVRIRAYASEAWFLEVGGFSGGWIAAPVPKTVDEALRRLDEDYL